MIQPKNIQFTNLIRAGGRLREFNFRKSRGIHDSMFTVDVASENGERFYIIFRLKDQTWIQETKLLNPLIEEVLPQIKEAIEPFKG
jgi:hypothetical protein